MAGEIRDRNPEQSLTNTKQVLAAAQTDLVRRGRVNARAIGGNFARDLMAGDPASEGGTGVTFDELSPALQALLPGVVEFTTGVLLGATLLINGSDNTKFDLLPGIGIIVDQSNPDEPKTTRIVISGGSGIADAFPAELLTRVFVNAAGEVFQQIGPATPLQRRTIIFIGRLVKAGGVITLVVNNPIVGYGAAKTAEDVLSVLGGIGAPLIEIIANSDLTLDVAAGLVVSLGRGIRSDPRLPNTIVRPAQSPVPVGLFFKLFEDAGGDLVTDTTTNTLDPMRFNNNGVLAPVPVREFTIQRVFVFSESNVVAIYYGNTTYPTLASAIADRDTEDWQEHPDTSPAAFRAYIIVQEGVTDLAAAIIAEDAAIIIASAVRPAVAKGTAFLPLARVGQFSDTTAQKPLVTTPVVVTFNTDDLLAGIEHSRPEDFKILTAGFYAFLYQPQAERTGSGGNVFFHGWGRTGRRDGPITAVVAGSPTTITAPDHRIQTGQTVTLSGLVTTPDINGAHVTTVVDADTFTVPVATSSVADGVGDWTRQLDVADDIARTNIELTLQNVFQDDVVSVKINKRFEEEDVVQFYQSVSDATKNAGLIAKFPTGEPVIPSAILSVNKIGDM